MRIDLLEFEGAIGSSSVFEIPVGMSLIDIFARGISKIFLMTGSGKILLKKMSQGTAECFIASLVKKNLTIQDGNLADVIVRDKGEEIIKNCLEYLRSRLEPNFVQTPTKAIINLFKSRTVSVLYWHYKTSDLEFCEFGPSQQALISI